MKLTCVKLINEKCLYIHKGITQASIGNRRTKCEGWDDMRRWGTFQISSFTGSIDLFVKICFGDKKLQPNMH